MAGNFTWRMPLPANTGMTKRTSKQVVFRSSEELHQSGLEMIDRREAKKAAELENVEETDDDRTKGRAGQSTPQNGQTRTKD
jgi:hypothetical protein